MSSIKRLLSFIPSISFNTKKLRNDLYFSSVSSNRRFEDLSNDLFYEIFDYLDGYDIFNAFSNLNQRFQNLLSYSTISIKVDFGYKSNSLLEHRCRHFIIPNKHRLLSLHLRNGTLVDEFFKYCTIDSSFHRLESIILGGLTDRKLLWILFYLNTLPRLSSLTICMEEYQYYNLGDIYRLIFSLPCLTYNKLSLFNYENIDINLPNTINEKFSSIKSLILDYACTTDQIIALIAHTPQLCYLVCERLFESDDHMKSISPITLPHLRSISIDECQIDFNQFKMFIKTISSQLEVLRIGIRFNENYLNANRWEKLIKNHMPHLYKFYFKYEQYADNVFNIKPGYTVFERFTSLFWTQRKWISELKINDRNVFFSIHPYKYVETYEHMEPEFHPIRLVIENNYSIEQSQLFINKVRSSCIQTQFTYLNINSNNLTDESLVEIIRQLPHLHYLEISSIQNIKNQLLAPVMNKIIKVKLNKFTEQIQIQFLINLCSHMEYLELGCTSKIDLGMLVEYISSNQMIHTSNLCFICLNVPNANENMIENLSKTFNNNYTIHRTGDKIFLQWKSE